MFTKFGQLYLFTFCQLAAYAAANDMGSMAMDNEGRLHINANDLIIHNTSFRGVMDQLNALKQQVLARNQQIAQLEERLQNLTACAASEHKFNSTEVGKLVASDGAASQFFGSAVAATDGTVVVGATGDRGQGSSSGSVYVFEKNSNGQYEQVSKLVASDGAAQDFFGVAVAATENMVVVGASVDDNVRGKDSGSVYVFEKNSTGQYEQASKLVPSDGAAEDQFGHAVAVVGSMIVVGARSDDNKGMNSGSVYMFEKNSAGQYEQVDMLMASDGSASDRFGSALAATDGIVVVGSWTDDDGANSGSVYVFEKDSTGQYEQVIKLVASDGAANDHFGMTVAVTAGGVVVVGMPQDDDKGSNSGSAYVFEKNSTGQYEQVSKLVASDGAADNRFGVGVAATTSMVLVGADHFGEHAQSGVVYVFEKNSTGQYVQVSKLVASDGASTDRFGHALAATDGMVVVGANVDDHAKGTNAGSAYVFE